MSECLDIKLIWEAVEKLPTQKYPIIIRVFGGGRKSVQTDQLVAALASLNITIIIQT